ncbi:MAG: KH domain-containing protein [Actinobacteria bacterium]|nr:KH domain-containing protein [Actinomycetota bacterium]
MKELLIYIAQHLVEDPDAVSVEEVQGGRSLLLQLTVAPDDRGKVIGRGGRTARAIRSVMRAAGVEAGQSTIVEIVGE